MIVPMQQFTTFWGKQTKPQRITLIALVVAAAVLIPLFIVWATTPSYSVAFSGLDETSAGQIVEKLDELGIQYKLRDTSTIMVPTNQVYEVRMKMATSGLPESGTVGFELFSNTSSFGMTEFTQKVNYQRALEGELERTIGSLSAVKAVQVHIVTPEKTLLSSEQDPTTASVTIDVKPGENINQAQVQSITHLVASSVEGLKAENVVLVDTNGTMLASGNADGSEAAGMAQADTHRAAELAAASQIQKKVQTVIDSVLGPNRSVVQASVVMDWTQRQTTSQTYDPTPMAVRSSQKTNETYSTNGTTTGGVPGAGSNLPTPVATTVAGSGTYNYQRTDETINYEISQSQVVEVAAPGEVKKISLSVRVDGVTETKQLETLKTAVAAAAGIDATRGDTLAVDTLAFDRTVAEEQATELASSEQMDLYIKIGEIVAAVLLVGALLFYVARMMRNLRMNASETWIPVMKPVAEAAALSGAPMETAGGLPEMAMASDQMPASILPPMPAVPTPTPQDDQMQKMLVRMTEENPASVAEIIQLWLNEDEEHHG